MPLDYAATSLPGRIKSISSRPHSTRLAPWTLWYAGRSVDCARMTTRRFQVANAGVNEIGDYCTPKVKNGKPEKPTMITVDINLLGSLYSKYDSIGDTRDIHLIVSTLAAHLAIHFLELGRKPDDTLKSLVLIGSMGRLSSRFCWLNSDSDI